MIVSHQHRLIFIKTRKTAGTSIELFLRQFCGPDDVMTPNNFRDERLAKSLQLPSAQEHAQLKMPWQINKADIKRAQKYHRLPRQSNFRSHLDATSIRRIFGQEVWDSYTKVTIVRNPWDVAISLFFWKKFNNRLKYDRDDDPEGVPNRLIERAGLNWSIYSIHDEPTPDFYIRYENLETDLAALCDSMHLDPKIALPRAKGNARPRDTQPSKLLTEEQIRRIGEVDKLEIDLFGYEPS